MISRKIYDPPFFCILNLNLWYQNKLEILLNELFKIHCAGLCIFLKSYTYIGFSDYRRAEAVILLG
jgi:hypothetical protein